MSRVEFNPLLKKLNFSQPNLARICGEPGWLTGWNSFWHLYMKLILTSLYTTNQHIINIFLCCIYYVVMPLFFISNMRNTLVSKIVILLTILIGNNLASFDCPRFLDFYLQHWEPCPLLGLLSLLLVLNKEPPDSLAFLLQTFSLRIKSLIPLKLNFIVPDVLVIAVKVSKPTIR